MAGSKKSKKKKIDFSRFDTFILDLDGTLWKWNKVIPGAPETITALKKAKKSVIIVTNNSMISRRALTMRLNRMGIRVHEKQLITPNVVAANYFKKKARKKTILAIGKGVQEDFRRAGLKVTNKIPADVVFIGQDMDFNYMKIMTAYAALQRGAELYGSTDAKRFLVGNEIWPGTGILINAVERVSGKKAEILGKPSVHMERELRKANPSPARKTVLIGDSYKVDIRLGKRMGYYTVLVKSGLKRKPIRGIKPDAVLKSVAEIKV